MENPLHEKQKELDRWKNTRQMFFSPKEIEKIREEVLQEIKDIGNSYRISLATMDSQLEKIDIIFKKVCDIEDRLAAIESSLVKEEQVS